MMLEPKTDGHREKKAAPAEPAPLVEPGSPDPTAAGLPSGRRGVRAVRPETEASAKTPYRTILSCRTKRVPD